MYSHMPEEFPALMRVCKKLDNQIRQRWVEKVAQNKRGGLSVSSSARPQAPPKNPAGVPTITISGYTEPARIDLSAGKRRILAEESATRYTDWRCLYRGGLKHRAAELVACKKAQPFKALGAEIIKVGTRTSSEKSGNDLVN